MKDRLQTLLVVLVLLAVGALVGSFWLEWRHARVPSGGAAANVAPEERIRVEVLNGAGDAGAAEQVARRLRDSGFDVVYFGNAERFDHGASVALNRSGRDGAAARVAASLGIDSIETRIDRELYLDVTLILGDDWGRLLEEAGSE